MALGIDHLLRAHYLEFHELAVSPDDRQVLAVFGNFDMQHDDYSHDERNRSIWRISLGDGDHAQLTEPEHDSHAAAWSPDGSRIAYVARRSGRNEIWVMNRDGSGKRQLTHSAYPARNPWAHTTLRWSPNGDKLACVASPRGCHWSIMVGQCWWMDADKTGRIAVDGKWAGIPQEVGWRIFESEVCLVDVGTGEIACLAAETGGPFRLFGWYADGGSLLVEFGGKLLALDTAGGETQILYMESVSLAIAEEHGVVVAQMSGTDLVVGSVSGGELVASSQVTVPAGFRLLTWRSDGRTLYGIQDQGMSRLLISVDSGTGTVRTLTKHGKSAAPSAMGASVGPVTVLNGKGGVLFPCTSLSEPSELWRCPPDGMPEKVSSLHADLRSSDLGEARIVRYVSDGWEIESAMLLPLGYRPGDKCPTLFFIHGGPQCNVGAEFLGHMSARAYSAAHWLAAHGYAVLLPNFRGSTGYGQEFMEQINNHRQMTIPYADLMAGVDYMINQGIANPDRLGLYGSSFGGWLTAWAIGHTSRFRGAAGVVGVYDLAANEHFRGTWWTDESEGSLRLHPEIALATSPLEHVTSIRTPMLIVDSGEERRYGNAGSLPLWSALSRMDVDVHFAYYPHAFHNGGWNDEYKTDYMHRLLAWFDYCLKGQSLPGWFDESGGHS